MDGRAFIGDIEVHPAANLFPEMDEENLEHLSEDIKTNGVREPITFFRGALVDGRNRVRATLMAGLDPAKLPRRNLQDDEDPYGYAWSRNCERLDYTPAQKAAIRAKVEEEQGKLAEARLQAFRAANEARAKAALGNQNAAKENSRRPPERQPSPAPRPTEQHASAAARHLADAADVSVSTARRVLDLKEKDPEGFETLARTGKVPKRTPPRKLPETWRVPRDIRELAAFLREHLTTSEIDRLGDLLRRDAA